jgi:hypothetical protein
MRSFLSISAKSLALVLMVASMSTLALANGGLPPVGTPEIDPNSIAAAATLLSGGVLWLTGRRRVK